MRPLILLLIALVPATWARATHLIGGELYYTSVGNGQYEVTLKMYRDCGPNNTNGTGFDATAIIAAYRLDNNAFVTSVSVPLSGTTDVPIALNNPCLTPPGTICVEEGLYVATMTLPGGLGGYTLAYQRCCRSPAVINLDAPETQGLTCTVTIPDTDVSGENSSPRFSAYPSIALTSRWPSRMMPPTPTGMSWCTIYAHHSLAAINSTRCPTRPIRRPIPRWTGHSDTPRRT